MRHWIVELEDGTRVFFSSHERADEFAWVYRKMCGGIALVLEKEE